MIPPMRVLVVDDEPFNIDLVVQELEEAGIVPTAVDDGASALAAAKRGNLDLILLDAIMPGLDGFAVCARLKADADTRDIPVIFMTALRDEQDKVRAFSAGAVDYVTKPFQTRELLARVRTHVELRRAQAALEQQNRRLRAEIEAHRRAKESIRHLVDEIDAGLNGGEIVGNAPPLLDLIGRLQLVAATDSTVLVLGETGTGKELVARAVHGRSPRRAQPLVKVNCAALPRDLVESELFGHEKGAFTGATQQHKGRFELADGGTIFLDELGELPLEAQVKLLRVLQEGEFERIGGSRTFKTDARVIAATNRDLTGEVEAGRFRSDLFYRLNVFPLTVPSLRERRDDIPLLARHFLTKTARKLGKDFLDLSPGFVEQALAYAWPGNIRELENAVTRAAILSPGPLLEVTDPLAASSPERLVSRPQEPHPIRTLERVEREHIEATLQHTQGIIEGEHGAAALLGLHPSTLRGRMRKLAIALPRARSGNRHI